MSENTHVLYFTRKGKVYRVNESVIDHVIESSILAFYDKVVKKVKPIFVGTTLQAQWYARDQVTCGCEYIGEV